MSSSTRLMALAAMACQRTGAIVTASGAARDEPAGEPIKGVVVVDGFSYNTRDPHRTRTVHKPRSVGLSTLAMLSAIAGLPLSSGVHMPARFKPKPPRETTQADLDRLAQAEAKRLRRAQKRQK